MSPLVLQHTFDTDLTSARARYQQAFAEHAKAKQAGDTRLIHVTLRDLTNAKTELLRAELAR